MLRPHCTSTTTRERTARIQLGYRTFVCHTCRRGFNERTGTPFNYFIFPSNIILQVVLWRLRCKLSFRDLAAMFLERGFVFTHEAECTNALSRPLPQTSETTWAKLH